MKIIDGLTFNLVCMLMTFAVVATQPESADSIPQGLNHEWPPHGQLFGTAYATFFTESRRHLARGAQLNRPFVAARRILKSFTARLKSCPDTKQSLPQPGYPVVDLLSETPESRYVFSAGGLVFERSAGLARPIRVIMDV